jgi:hypothetical protein
MDKDDKGREVVIDAKICIIDFGRSEKKNLPEKDLYQIRTELLSVTDNL